MNAGKENQMQDDELYALLDSVMEDERLKVREDLIQTTLQRVKEEESKKEIPVKSFAGKRYRILSYAGMAAAAVLVLFVGVKTINNGGFTGNNMKADSVAESPARGDNSSILADSIENGDVMDGADGTGNWWYSTKDDAESEAMDADSPMEPFPSVSEKTETSGSSTKVCSAVELSGSLREMLFGSGYEQVATAKCWEFRKREGDWQEELQEELYKGAVEQGFPAEGDYSYELCCDDGTVWNVKAEFPLDLVVRIERRGGVLWGCFGKTVRVYWEG